MLALSYTNVWPDLKTKYLTSFCNDLFAIFFELCLKWGWLSVLVRRWMEDYWCLFVVVAMLVFFFFLLRAGTSAFAFSHPMTLVLLRALFSVSVYQIWSTKAVSDYSSALVVFLMINMYVPLCMSFDIYCGIFSVWKSMKALPCTPLWPCINELYFSRKSFVSDYPFTFSSLELNPSSYFWWNTAHSCLSASFQCVLCSDLMALNASFHCTVALNSPFVFLLSDDFC